MRVVGSSSGLITIVVMTLLTLGVKTEDGARVLLESQRLSGLFTVVVRTRDVKYKNAMNSPP